MEQQKNRRARVVGVAVVFVIIAVLLLVFRVRTLSAHGACTENACPSVCDAEGMCRPDTEDCCHDCWFGGWQYEKGGMWYEATGSLPECELDGCGRCEHLLKAWGLEIPLVRRFVVLDYSVQSLSESDGT